MSCTVLVMAALSGCGEVYSALDAATQATTEPVFVPNAVSPNSITLMTIRARFDADGTAWVDSTGFNGLSGIAMAFPEKGLGFSPGECPTDIELVTGDVAEDVAATVSDPTDEQGRYVFCGAIEVGEPTESMVNIPIVFWNGTESVSGTGSLSVVASVADDTETETATEAQ